MAVDFARVDNDDYASRSSTGFNHNAAYTALTWFKIDTNPAQYQHFVNISGSYAYDGNTDFIGTDEVTPILFRYGCAGGASSSFLTSGVLTVGVWYWCALVRESSTNLKVYRGTNSSDGALIATLTNNVGARASASLMSLGGYNSANINGPIALPRFWSGSSLTLAQLHAEVGSYSPVITSNLWTAPAFSGADFTAAMADLSGNARNWTRSGTDSTIVADPISPSSGASQSIAFTLDGVTAEIDQTATHSQELAATLEGVAVAIAQTLTHDQALAATLDGVTVAVDQVLEHSQALVITLDGVDVEINQAIETGKSQAIAFTLDGVTIEVEQTATHPQSLAATLDGVSVEIEQVSQHSQETAVILDDVTVEIDQSVSSPTKDQELVVTLDDVAVSVAQVGPESTAMGGGFFSYAWRRKLMEEELREQLKNLPDPVAEVIERQVIESVDRPKMPSPKELRARLERENIPYRQAYQKAMVSLVNEIRQREEDDEEEEAIAIALVSLV